MEFSIKDFFSKCDQIPSFLQIWSHLLKKPLMENSFFYAVLTLIKMIKNCLKGRKKTFAQTIMNVGKLNKNYLSKKVCLYKNLSYPCRSHQIQIHLLKK